MAELPKIYPIWVDARNTRVYGMDSDDQGTLWFTGSLPILYRYWPRTGTITSTCIPSDHGGSQSLCAGGKVYVLPQTRPRITVYHVADSRVYQVDKPFPEANLWYGEADKERSLLYLPERSRPCLVLWDVERDEGQVFPYPEEGSLPCILDIDWPQRLKEFPIPVVKGWPARRVYFDPEVRRFIAEHIGAIPPVHPRTEENVPRYLVTYEDGWMIRLDLWTGEHYKRAVPGWGEEFGFIGGGVFHRGWQLNNLSTYNGSFRYNEQTGEYVALRENPHLGVDGYPYHFMDRFLAYHPETDRFDVLVPDVPAGRYPQLCYSKVVGNELYITANDIWSSELGRPLGSDERPIGRLMVLQSHPVQG